MSDLRVDGDSLREAARRSREVVESFATAGSDAHDAADHVGHDGLASRVRDFASGWDIHRGKLGDELRQIADMLEAVDDTFTDLDNNAAGTLRQATSQVMGVFTNGGHSGGHAGSPDPVLPLRRGGGA